MTSVTPAAASPRDRILATASTLFYQRGINNVGIDLLVAESGVAKMTLYRHFASKDELVLAFLEKTFSDISAWLRSRVEASRLRGRNRPLAIFDALEEWFETPEFRGCPFIGSAAEMKDSSHPVHRAAWKFKQKLRNYFEELLRESGHRDAAALADQILLLFDGAVVRAAMQGGAGSARSARRVAALLLRK